MNFILNNQIRYYARQTLKLLSLITVGIFIITLIIMIKYKPAYKVSFLGKEIGYIQSKEKIKNTIDEYINNTGENVAFIALDELPIYKFEFISNSVETNEAELLAKVQEESIVMYRTYAITLNGENKAYVNSLTEAEEVIEKLKVEHIDEGLNIGIQEIYMENEFNIETVQVEIAKNDVEYQIDLNDRGVNGVLLDSPVKGIVSSRFGNRWGRTHTGLDIATSTGTPIYACASGIVTYVAYNGGYGNLVKISHENGVETWYAHCSQMFVAEGQNVKVGEHIAAVGSTGNSTGPHLHLEIRINGIAQNPQEYLYKQ